MKKKLKQPFETLQEKQLLTIGTLFLFIFSFIAYYTNTRFTGILNIDFRDTVYIHQPLMDNIIHIVCLSIFVYGLAYFVNKKTRLIDIVAIAMISRIPIYFVALFNITGNSLFTRNFIIENIKNQYSILDLPTINLIVFILMILYIIIAMVLFCILLYKGFKTATNAKKLSHSLLLIPIVLIANIISQLLVSLY